MSDNLRKIIIAGVIAVFLTLSIASALTHRPQIDEGMFASPAYNLAFNGHFGTTVLEKEKATLTRIDERTYWVMPMFLLNASAAFKTLGFSIVSMRLVNVFWGLVLLAAVYFIALKLSNDRRTALIALVLASCDYMVLETASSARMDMMTAALGFSAIAVYLVLRERNLQLAVVLSQTLIVIDGLTHPNAITAFVALVIVTLWLDRRRLLQKPAREQGLNIQPEGYALANARSSARHRVSTLLLGILPYLIGGTAFGIWILQDVEAFKNQFIDNALMGGRMSALSSPLGNIVREFTEHYPHAYGLGQNSGGHSGPIYLKSLMLIGYIAGIIGSLLIKELRQSSHWRLLMTLTLAYFLIMAIIDGQKQTTYLIHIVPLYIILLAGAIGWMWRQMKVPRVVLVVAILGLIALPAGGMLLKIKQNTHGNFYAPVIAHLKTNMGENDYVMGGADLAFGLGFEANLIADGRYGYYTGKRPRYIVSDSATDLTWQNSQKFFPEFYEYFPRLLRDEYRVSYENAAYKIYERRLMAKE
ncbi:MAG: hypothetical protein ACKVQW_15335 [Pyrinomonadaceae bacterium]